MRQNKSNYKNIFISKIEKNDKEEITHLIKLAQDTTLINLMGWYPFFELDEIDKFIEAISECVLPYSIQTSPILFGIYLDSQKLPIGYVVLKGLNTNLSTVECGVAILDKRYRVSGCGRIALKKAINYAFEKLKVKTIGVTILSSNRLSINMVKKIGFTIKKVMYDSWKMPNKEIVDMVWMELKAV